MIDRHLWIANCLTQTLSDLQPTMLHHHAEFGYKRFWGWEDSLLFRQYQDTDSNTPPLPLQYWIIHNRQLKTQVQNKVMIAEGSAVQKILLGQKVRADTWKQGQTRLKNDEDPKAPSPVFSLVYSTIPQSHEVFFSFMCIINCGKLPKLLGFSQYKEKEDLENKDRPDNKDKSETWSQGQIWNLKLRTEMKPENKDRPESKVSNLMFYAQSTNKLLTLLSGLSLFSGKDRPESKDRPWKQGQTLKTRTDLTPPQCRCTCNQSLFIMKGKTKQTQSLWIS